MRVLGHHEVLLSPGIIDQIVFPKDLILVCLKPAVGLTQLYLDIGSLGR